MSDVFCKTERDTTDEQRGALSSKLDLTRKVNQLRLESAARVNLRTAVHMHAA